MKKIKTIKWKDFGNNQVLNGKGFYISYNSFEHGPSFGISSWRSDNSSAETALCKDGGFLILNGDFRKQYEKLVPKGYGACKKFYENNQEMSSSWSDE